MDIDLMKIEDFNKLGRTPRPYFYFFKSGGKCIYYLGVKHSTDKNNSQFSVIEHYFNDFLKVSEGTNIISIVEGGAPKPYSTIEESIDKHGEVGFLVYLSHKKDIPVISPEPPQDYEKQRLLKKFRKDEIISYYFVRQVIQYNRFTVKPDYEDYITHYLKEYERKLDWGNYDFSLESVQKTFEKVTKSKFKRDDQYYLTEFDDPTEIKYITNSVARECSNIRDTYIIKRLVELWDKGYSLFIVYGSYHAIVQEPALKKLIK